MTALYLPKAFDADIDNILLDDLLTNNDKRKQYE